MRDTLGFRLFSMAPAFLQRHILLKRARRDIDETGEIELLHLAKFVSRGDTVVDIGANSGTYSLALAELTNRVIAIEANPRLAAMLRTMRLPGVEVVGVALSASEGSMTLNVINGNYDEATLRTQNLTGELTSVQVKTRSLDSMGLDGIGFIKIDVEGFEEEVLAGATKTINADLPTLLIEIEERHNQGGLARISELLGKSGYEAFFLYKNMWNPLSAFDPSVHQDERKLQVENAFHRRKVDYVNNFVFVQPKIIEKLVHAEQTSKL
jgi:FkbM family methyltransferase